MRKDLDYDSIMRTQNTANKQKIVKAFGKEKHVHTKEWRIRMASFSTATPQVRN